MGFFKVPHRPAAEMETEVLGTMPQPPWFGPVEDVLPGAAPLRLVLARTDDIVVAVTGALAQPGGFGFALRVRVREPLGRRDRRFDPFGYGRAPGGRAGDAVPDHFLRFGVWFADGTGAGNLDPGPFDLGPDAGDTPPPGPVIVSQGGSVTERSWDMEQWVWPLPPPGPLAFWCAWPARGIAKASAEVDAGVLRDAAAQAIDLWEPARPPR